jgi:monofunctional biosynthetic peptidoglycan transglycosylase
MVALVGLIAAIVFLLVGGPDVQALRANDPASTPLIDAHRLTGRGVSWTPVPYEEVSSELVLAVLVGEDIDFFSHNGFSASEIRVAIEEAVLEGKRLRGASTISQQVARYLWLSRERSAKRKVEEAWLTWRLERTLSKRRILELYLNLAEFSPGIFGVEAAAHHYFEKRAAELDADEAAALAASLPAAAWRPGSDRDGYRAHIERIRRRMDEAAWLRPLI